MYLLYSGIDYVRATLSLSFIIINPTSQSMFSIVHMYVSFILIVEGIDYELLSATLNKIYNLILIMLWCSDLNQAFK